LRAADAIVRFFCVGEAVSIPLLRGAWHAAPHSLPRAILGRIVRDEAAHGTFGFTFLDWAIPQMTPEEVAHLGRAADIAIRAVYRVWQGVAHEDDGEAELAANPLAWFGSPSYMRVAHRAMEQRVRAPLRARGIFLMA
jgi:hypothetical protein